jgi:hypothetical protein
MAHGSAAAWGHLNLIGEYDFSEDKLQDSVGIKLPKLTDKTRSRLGSSGIAENPLRHGSWQESCGTLRTFVGLTPITSLGIFASLFKEMLVVQIVTFAGSLATIASGYIGRIPEDGKTSLFETYSQLVEGRFEGTQLLQEIEIYLEIDIKDEHEAELRKLIGNGNSLCKKLNALQIPLLDSASVETNRLKSSKSELYG